MNRLLKRSLQALSAYTSNGELCVDICNVLAMTDGTCNSLLEDLVEVEDEDDLDPLDE